LSSSSRRGRGIFPNLLWLGALVAVVLATLVVWKQGGDWFAPSRETYVVKVFRDASPAVVNISAEPQPGPSGFSLFGEGGGSLAERFFRQFYGAQAEQNKNNLGSGIIVDPRGYILTNEHVISNAAWIEVTLADGHTASGEVWATEPSLDLAVIKIETDQALPYLQMGRSDDLMIGEPVVVIGNPLGLGHTCSTGILSSLHRSVQAQGNRIYRDLVQIDAAVNPGNSGGPVLNIRGELIGITSALPMDTQAQGIGFAIPIDRARAVVEDLIKYRYVPTGWLGLSVEDMGEAALEYGLSGGKGVFISRVEDKSPAAQHFKAGDMIAAWDGTSVNELADFVRLVRALKPGQKVVLTRTRDGKSKDVEITSAAFPEELADDWAWFHLGIRVGEGQVQALTRDGRIVVRTGVFIEGIAGNSPAQAGGLTVGDLILKLNREEVGGRDDFRRAVAQVRARENAFMIFQRSGYPLPLWVTIPFRMSGERW